MGTVKVKVIDLNGQTYFSKDDLLKWLSTHKNVLLDTEKTLDEETRDFANSVHSTLLDYIIECLNIDG